jgi:hypothetical protein
MSNTTANSEAACSVAVSGVSSVAASNNWQASVDGLPISQYIRVGTLHTFTGLTAGSNTFTMKYRAGSNTAGFQLREINVIPL